MANESVYGIETCIYACEHRMSENETTDGTNWYGFHGIGSSSRHVRTIAIETM